MPQTTPDLASHPLTQWNGPFGLPDFSRITDDQFAPAFEAALEAHVAEIAQITGNPEAPNINNTLAALELAGKPLSRVTSIFWCKAGAHTNPEIQALEREFSPQLARHMNRIHMNEVLFSRLDALYRDRETLSLDGETLRVLDKTWKRFVRGGALLDEAGKSRLATINEELASLGAVFGQNVLKDESEWALTLGKDDLDGLPPSLIDAMASAAEARGNKGSYAVTLSRSIYEPFMAFSRRRDLREIALKAFIGRGEGAEGGGNAPLVQKTLALRAEKAKLLGYENFAAFKLDDTMAKTPASVLDLLTPVWEKARARVAEEEAALRELAVARGDNHPIAAWDWRYYAEQLRAEKFAFDEAELKPYFQLDNIIRAAFDVAGRLFGLTFEEEKGVAAWHEDVRTFQVKNRDGSFRGLFLADYFNRPSKRSGAWMSALQSGYRAGGGQTPIIYNVMNFARPQDGAPALLSLDEAHTLFHEFGHALHGLLSDVYWPSIAGTSVARDFVELPSQLFEHWLMVPEVLERHALHAQTGKPLPKEMIERLDRAKTFDAGFATVEFASSALVDMAFHAESSAPADPILFEAEVLEKLGAPASIPMRHRTPHFLHVFSGDGYSAGYYSYMWSEVLDADAFEAFTETGNPFDPETAEKLARSIYSAGGSEDPEALYRAFRGRMPTPDAMLKKRGLL